MNTPACSACGQAVDWVRFTYSADWRLFRGAPDRLTNGEYVRVPFDTPHFHTPHYFGSRFHTSPERNGRTTLGQVDGTYSWTPGSGGPETPFNRTVGSADQFTFGATDNADAELGLIQGYPPACFEPSPCQAFAMRFSPQSFQSWRFAAQVLVLLAIPDDTAKNYCIANIPGILDITSRVSLFESPPSYVILRTACATLFFCYGTVNAQQAAMQIFNSATGPIDQGPFSTNPFWWDISTLILDAFTAIGADDPDAVYCFGHSYGGALAKIVANRIKLGRADRDVRTWTCGCPRIGDRRAFEILPRSSVTDIQDEGDPVPCFPPGAVFNDFWVPFVDPAFVIFWNGFAKSPQRLILNGDGTFEWSMGPGIALTVMGFLIVLISTGSPIAASAEHFMVTYQGRIDALDFCPPAPPP